jgi:hypothetical protein
VNILKAHAADLNAVNLNSFTAQYTTVRSQEDSSKEEKVLVLAPRQVIVKDIFTDALLPLDTATKVELAEMVKNNIRATIGYVVRRVSFIILHLLFKEEKGLVVAHYIYYYLTTSKYLTFS